MPKFFKYSVILSALVSIGAVANVYPQAQTYANGIANRGISLAGGDFADDGSGNAPSGKFIPTIQDAALFLYRGMNTYRIPVVWEYLADINGNFKTDSKAQNYLKNLDQVISDLNTQGATIILDLHNYMRYNPSNISLDYLNQTLDGSDVIGVGNKAPNQLAYANLWANLAQRYPSSHMVYAIMNEPHDVSTVVLLGNENAAIAAIRQKEHALGITSHMILVDGNYWTGLHSWTGLGLSNTQTPNAKIYPAGIKDSANNYAIDVHQYFDSDSSGTYQTGDCLSFSDFKSGYTYQGQQWPGFDTYWPQFTQWAKANQVKVVLGEFGSPDTANCRQDIQYLLNNLSNFAYTPKQNYGVIGWLVWSAGSSWGNYPLSVAPGGPANTLMWDNALYENYLTATAPLPPLGPKILTVTNKSKLTFLFSSGNWPFQVKGSAALPPGAKADLYSPILNNTSPSDKFELDYHLGNDNSDVLGVGVLDNYGYGYGTLENISPQSTANCSIKTPNGDPKRCWELKLK